MTSRQACGADTEIRRLYYAVDGTIVTAEVDRSALLEPARRLFPHYEIRPPGGDVSCPPDVSLATCPSGYVLRSNDAPSVLCASMTEALAALEHALARAIAASLRGYVHLHAAGAVLDGQAVLALGKSGAGKSSLAVSWLSRGLPALGDDIVLVNSGARAVPFKRLFKVTPLALRTLGVDPAATLLWDPDWPEAWYAPDDGPGWADEAPVAVMAFVRFEPNGPLRLTPMSTAESLNSLVHSMMDTGMRAADGFDTVVRVVEGARVFRMEYPSADQAAEALCRLTK